MTVLRTTYLAAALGLTAMPVLAEGITIDLPRLEFPSGAAVTRGCIDPVAEGGTCTPAAD